MKNQKHTLRTLVIALALLARLMNPTSARADDGTPPSPLETPVETFTVEPTEVIATESPTLAPTDLAPNKPGVAFIPTEGLSTKRPDVTATEQFPPRVEPVETATPIPPAATPDSPDKPALLEASTSSPIDPTPSDLTKRPRVSTLGEVLRDIPENTGVIVLDDFGKPLALVSQEAAQVITESDPVWCPVGQPPTPGANGCTFGYATLNDLLAYEGTYIDSQNTNGIIWITSGPVADTSPITIDGSSHPNWANYTLQLQGGWTGIYGDETVSSMSVFSVPITIANWNNSLSLADLSTDTLSVLSPNGVVILANIETQNMYIDSPTGRIDVYGSRGDLHVNNADINNNGLFSAGINIHTLNGNVSIQNSVFHGNGYDGIWMENVNDVFIDNSQFYENLNTGISILNAGTVTVNNSNAGAVTINNNSFSGNLGLGMSVSGTNALIISNSTFNSNGFSGLIADTAGNVTLNNVTTTNNGGDGLGVSSWGGNIMLQNITANGNTNFGAGVYSANGIVSLTGSNTFNGNDFIGVGIVSAGDMTIENVTASGNVYLGMSASSAFGTVLMNGTNTFNGNALGDGLVVSTGGDIMLNNITAQGNGATGVGTYGGNNVTLNHVIAERNGIGVFISNAGNITLHDVTAIQNGSGVSISSAGDVILDNVTAIRNDYGVSISNAGNVTLSGGGLSYNDIGLNLFCVQSVIFTPRPTTTFTRNITPISIDPSCPINIIHPQSETFLKVQGKLFTLDCANRLNRFVVRLANGDQGEIFCPVEGEASIDRVDNTTLPASLPIGYTYASAFDVRIQQNNERIDVITEGGYITASFLAQQSQSGNTYSILYWDAKNGTWVPLKDLLLNDKGKPQSFELYPGANDERRIFNGVHLVTKNGETRVEVSTNFPGIFVLAQH